MRLSFTVLAIAIFPLLVSLAMGDDPTNRQVSENLIAKQALVQQKFDNLYAVWDLEIQDTEGSTTNQRIEFWSRAGTYFRVDQTDLVDGQPAGAVLRCVVRPEGYVRTSSQTATAQSAVIKFGPASEGIEFIKGHRFFGTACRDTTTLPVYKNVTDLLAGKFQERRPWAKDPRYSVNTLAGGNVQVTASFGAGDDISKCKALLDDQSFLVTSASSESSVSNGVGSKVSIKNSYNRDEPIPQTSLVTRIWEDGAEEFDRLTLVKSNFEPAPLDVFAIDAFGPVGNGNNRAIWWRRLMVAAIGVLLTGIYFRYRRRSDKSRST